MPNWCVNKLYVKGRAGDKAEFFQYASGRTPELDLATRLEGEDPDGALDFNQFIPYPSPFKEMDAGAEAHQKQHGFTMNGPKDGYNSGGYEWCVANWGTKWNASGSYREENMLHFQTAWGPPLPVVLAMSRRFPTLTFTIRYYECGSGFQGVHTYKNGNVLREESRPYHGKLGG